ncbi:DinB family protein [Ornithinimicrobium sp. W1679]|uniref:DinB family protein n=1 Tax=Ornithinimicrobium sp. W1679 TaxID=3418770 RepID=UPI003CF770F7
MDHDATGGRPRPVPPDTKDWTVVLTDGCAECGFDADVDVRTVGERLRASVPTWRSRLAEDDVRERPAPTVWSPLEYAAHVRDVLVVMRERLALMLAEDGAQFAGWDQDRAAVEGRYAEEDPDEVARQLAAEAGSTAEAFDAVPDDAWGRRGFRAGTAFTVATLAVYLLHDVEHHVHDVKSSGRGVTG